MNRRRFLAGTGSVGVFGLAGCLGDDDESPIRQFRVGEDTFEVGVEDNWEEVRIRGLNLGMAKPGAFPGEAAITREEYDRWLASIGELGANALRVYTIHPPAFYEALASYNHNADEPLYLFHGTWIGEERLREFGDVTELSAEFQEELRRTVDAVHGDVTLSARPGHASGEYTADVSNAVLGYIAGIEWPPTVVIETNERGERDEYDGQYLQSSGAAFEQWLAESLDATISYERDEYSVARPVSFTNWVTTDPLEHPYEPFDLEDAVSVDPDTLTPTDEFGAGTFASYHVYPYYPDFLNHTPEYVEYTDHRGEMNSYAGYLSDLVAATDQPLLIAEFGVPDSRGKAHDHVHGRHQGGHTEREQGDHVAAMYEDIVEAGTAGGLVFTWQDEWFKRTWNLQAQSTSHRRPFWSNVQTPEQRFGLLTFESENPVRLDGSSQGWENATRMTPDTTPTSLGDDADGLRELVAVDITHDVSALSLRLEFASLSDPVDWSTLNALVLIGLTDEGNTTIPLGTEARTPSTDFLVHLGGPDDSRIRVDAHYDVFARLFGAEAGLDLSEHRQRDSGRFTPIRMTINRGYTVPPTGETVPFEAIETGELRYGVGNPDSLAYDSQTDVHVSPGSNTIELRIPWLMLNVSDPSSRLRLGSLWEDEVQTTEPFESLAVAVATYAPDADGTATEIPGETNLTHAVPGFDGAELTTETYSWEEWHQPSYQERRKRSYDSVRETFSQYSE